MKILIAGDYVPRNRLDPLVEAEDYSSIFGEVSTVVNEMDYAIINFESPIAVQTDRPISKCGPNLKCSANAVHAIKFAGFNCATLANNHIRDYGDIAVKRTIDTLSANGLDYVGAGSDIIEAKKNLYKSIKGQKLAIVNCCENEFSIAQEHKFGANPLNPIQQYYSIKEAKIHSDYVIVIVHGGHEHYQLPSTRMQDTYRFFIDSGADLVINHHQHCYSGYEIYNGRPIVYGLGNFCMDRDPVCVGQMWNYGYMVVWDTDMPDVIQLKPYEQCGINPSVHLLSSSAFDFKIRELNYIISNRKELEKCLTQYYDISMTTIKNVIEPVQNKYFVKLQRRHIIPSLITSKWLLKLHDFILCESHRDKLDYFFKKNNI